MSALIRSLVGLLAISAGIPAFAAQPTGTQSKPSAVDLVQGIIDQESKIDSVRSIYLRFEGKWTTSPEAIARRVAELKKERPREEPNSERDCSLWPEMTEELEVAFDGKRVRKLAQWRKFSYDLNVFDGQRAMNHTNYFTYARESYALDTSPQRFFAEPFGDLSWLRMEGRVAIAYSGPEWIAFVYPRRLRRRVIGLSFDLSSADCRREDLLSCLAGFGELQWLDLGSVPIDDEGLRYVGRMDQLTRLTSTNSSITEAGAAQLARLPNLQELNLSGCHIDNAAIRKLADCPHLRKLMLRSAVAADELIDLCKVRGLSLLDLAGCKTEYGAAKMSNWLTGLDKLEELYLRDCPIQPGDIEAISRLKNLRILDLAGCTISASDLQWLSNLPRLKQLGLAPESINDETILVLHKLGQLELLSLNDGDCVRGNEFSWPDFFKTRLPALKRAFPSIEFDTRRLSYPEMRCAPGPRLIAVPGLIEEQEAGKTADGGTF